MERVDLVFVHDGSINWNGTDELTSSSKVLTYINVHNKATLTITGQIDVLAYTLVQANVEPTAQN